MTSVATIRAILSVLGKSRDFYRDKSSCVLRFVKSVKVVTQLVKIIYSKTPLNPKKGKGKPEKGSGAVTKKGRASVGGNRGFVSIKSIS